MAIEKGDVISLNNLQLLGAEISKLDKEQYAALYSIWEKIGVAENNILDEILGLEAIYNIKPSEEQSLEERLATIVRSPKIYEWSPMDESSLEAAISILEPYGLDTLYIPEKILGYIITHIGNFQNARGISQIILPNTCKVIGEAAFYAAHAESIIIPTSLVKIEREAFYDAEISTIYYKGSQK